MFFQYNMRYLLGSQKRIYNLYTDGIEKYVPRQAWMPISEPRDRFFYPTLRDNNNLSLCEGGIENASLGIPYFANQSCSGQIFLSHPHIHDRLLLSLTSIF